MSKTLFDRAFDIIITLEGGYSNHVNDRGGATKYGITESVARAHGYTGDMKDFTIEWAKKIYKTVYWDINKLDDIGKISNTLAIKIFDVGVNIGHIRAAKFLQECINILLNDNVLVVDGIIGSKTISYLKTLNSIHLSNLVVLLEFKQISHYLTIVSKDNSQYVFLNGWINRVSKFRSLL